MSYHMSIGTESFNYTYNVSDMWYACYPQRGIRAHYGYSGQDAIPILRNLRQFMEDHRETLIKMDPENGWGDFNGALQFVTDLINASLRNPESVWEGD